MRRVATFALTVALVAASVLPAAAQFYRWVDAHGKLHYAGSLHDIPEQFRSRAESLSLRNSPPATPGAAPGGPERIGAAGAQVRFTPGQRILVDVRLNERTGARLLLDTGADRTLINPQALSAAGVQLSRVAARGRMHGVTGSDEVVYVVLDSLEVGQARVERLPVAAYEMGSRESDGLLGRDFLDQFNVSIDSSRGVVTLTPK
jgi:hypothetical protein